MEKIIEIISGVKGCQFANIMYVADGGIPKKVINGVVTKLVITDCQVNYNYENAVNNRLEKQGDKRNFVAQSLPWGCWVEGLENKVIEHKGTYYLRFYNTPNANVKSLWFVNGKQASSEEFAKIMQYLQTKKTTSNTQAEKGLLENQVKPKLVKIENILRLAVNKQVFEKENKFAFV
jgi:hypothetical protein